MKIKAQFECLVAPFSVPNFVRIDPGEDEDRSRSSAIPLAELSADTLEALCAQFRVQVFHKAGKVLPPIRGTRA